MLPSTKSSTSVLSQYYQEKIEQFEAQNWRISARVQFDKVYQSVTVAERDGFKRHYFPTIYFMDNRHIWSHIREEMFNQQIDNMVKLVILCCDAIASSKHLRNAEMFYIFKCLKHLFWDAGFQAQISYVKQEGLSNVHTMQSLRDKGFLKVAVY